MMKSEGRGVDESLAPRNLVRKQTRLHFSFFDFSLAHSFTSDPIMMILHNLAIFTGSSATDINN